ncbi:MAG: ATP-binding protein [Cystobacter sp.]
MARSLEPDDPSVGVSPRAEPEARRGMQTWLKTLLDGFLSESLRAAPPLELHRHRVFIGSTLFAFMLTGSFVLFMPFSFEVLPSLLAVLCYATMLVLARRVRSLTLFGFILCLVMAQAYVASIFMNTHPEVGFHASSVLIPCFAVFLLGPRLGFVITGLLAVVASVLQPLYRLYVAPAPTTVPTDVLMGLYVATGASLLGAWVLSSLHSTSRDSAYDSLERTLKTLRESEGKLISILESTDDMVLSLDTRRIVHTINAAARRSHWLLHGRDLQPGEFLELRGTPELQVRWRGLFEQVLAGQRLRFEEEFVLETMTLVQDISMSPILGAEGQVVGMTLFCRDITARKVAEARLGEMHRNLVDVSRYAGMAEVATGVLHNVGNTLNSVNISAGLLDERLRHSRVSGLRKAAALLEAHASDMESFLSGDARGRMLPAYLLSLSDELENQRAALRQELGALTESVDHIKSIVSMQQQYARAVGVLERLPVPRLIEEALRLHSVSFERQGIRVSREYAEVPSILVDRHNLLQILINLLSNARDSLLESQVPDKRLRIRIRLDDAAAQLVIAISDNGLGIPAEHLARIFSQGFTTKKHGHGFGLHISALTAVHMGGSLSCASEGAGQGATFSLTLPVEGPGEGSTGGGAEGPWA